MKQQVQKHMITTEISAFLIDRTSTKLQKRTIEYYRMELAIWNQWCKENSISEVEQITPTTLRSFFIDLSVRRNNGGLHALYRAIRAWLNWWEEEEEPLNWRNPIKKVDPPKINRNPIPGVSNDDLQRMLNTCDRTFYGIRDRAIMVFLADTGVRVSEFCAIRWEDVDISTGVVVILHGKGDKRRLVLMGNNCRKDVLKYIRRRTLNEKSFLFAHKNEDGFQREGVRTLLLARAQKAGILNPPSPHDFRRFWFHNTRKRANDLDTARVGGHSDTTLLPRYDFQTPEDLVEQMIGTSPMDNFNF